MKFYLISSKLIAFFFGALVFTSSLKAELLDDNFHFDHLKGVKLGYYEGTFDPLHLGHENIIEQALQHVDYVLIYLIDDQLENRGDLELRQTMIDCVYQMHPKVLVTYWTQQELQEKLAPFTDGLEVIGIIDSAELTRKLEHSAKVVRGSLALSAKSFLVALKEGEDFSHLNRKIGDCPIFGFIQPIAHSSQEIRKAIQQGAPFEQHLSFYVQALIKEKGMYGFTSQFNHALKKQLLEMVEKDQSLRIASQERKLSQEEYKKWRTIDNENGKEVQKILQEHGWPGLSMVGVTANNAMWLLVQHQDDNIALQKRCLELLKHSVENHESSLSDYAYLIDRVNKNEGKPQVYGTQWLTSQNGKVELYAVEDVENLDMRRKSVGLSTMAEYKEQMKTVCHLSDEDFE